MTQSASYEADVLAWSKEQAALLRSLPKTLLPDELDLEHVAEEIEDVGRSELVAAESFVRLILVHLIKAASSPSSPAGLHWRREAVGFHNELLGRVTPSMPGRLSLPALWRRAVKEAGAALAVHGEEIPTGLPGDCPFGVAAIVDPDFDFDLGVSHLRAFTRA